MNIKSEENDCEITNLLLKNSCLSPMEVEKPLSPVLNSSLNRKVFNRKQQRKSRVKLSNRFITEKTEEESAPKLNEDSFNLLENENLIECLERLEEVEKNQETAYKVLVNNKKNDLCFKKPLSPAPKSQKKVKSSLHAPSTYLEQQPEIRLENEHREIILSQHKPITLPQSSNFQTATGKNIVITPENLQKHSTLFTDIISHSQTELKRSNKYNFLKKSSSDDHTIAVLENKDASLTQAIQESDITDAQLMVAVDNALTDIYSDNKEFKGFYKTEISKSLVCKSKLEDITNKNENKNISKKRELHEPDFPSVKKLRMNTNNFGDFAMASGKKININPETLHKAMNTFENIDKEFENSNNSITVPISDRGKTHNKNKDKLNYFDSLISESEGISASEEAIPINKTIKFNNHPQNVKLAFSKASGQQITMNTNYLKKANTVFKDIDLTEFQVAKTTSSPNCSSSNYNLKYLTNEGFSSTSSPNLSSSGHNMKNIELEYLSNEGFSTASGRKVSITSNSLNKAQALFEDLDKVTYPQRETTIQSSNPEKVHASKNIDKMVIGNSDITPLTKCQNGNIKNNSETKSTNSAIKDKLKYFDQLIGDDCDFVPRGDLNAPKIGGNLKTNKIPIVKQKLEYFDNLLGKDFPVKSISNKSPHFSRLDTVATNSNLSATCTTPVRNLNDSNIKKSKRKLGISSLKQISIPESKLHKAKLLFDEDLVDLSPIKHLVPQNDNLQQYNSCSTPIRNELHTFNSDINMSETVINDKLINNTITDDFKLNDNCIVTFDKPKSQTVTNFVTDLENEVKRLEERLIVIRKRQEAMELLKEDKPDSNRKPQEGILYQCKMKKDRISLRIWVNDTKPGDSNVDGLMCITPKNAEDIHFKESSATLSIKDGATVVPNIKDLIGISEIECSFKAMPGVDHRLIPKGWIKNHYKWIIWKLVSYERMFPQYLKGSLTVEQVIQQLKYRYDREIDKAERSAIRKILEKDDAPQKRMVLCVSDLKDIGFNSFELELSDGWYGVRTVIDEALCHQIICRRIKIGTKLIISGAELMNCDGCHPLDVTDLTFLKINFNCTRRAQWDAKLGYQKILVPFPIPIHTVHPNGGAVGCIVVSVVRNYPFRYLEKSGIKSVWRNKRAEDRRSQDWENERYKKLEDIEKSVRREFSSVHQQVSLNKGKLMNNIDISSITCPNTLLGIIESSNDPERIEEQLTSSQKTFLIDYKRNQFHRKQQEMASKITDSAEKLKMAKRDVVPVMKLLVVDLNGSPTKAYNFFIWKPTEGHVQMLKEESCLVIYNVYPKINGDLYAGTKTMFKQKTVPNQMCEIFRRKLIPIQDLNDLKFSKNFNEFDTVGIVVQITAESESQEIWLCDISSRLLLVKIYEASDTCLLLDTLRRGQVTSACNLIYRGVSNELMVCRASANHFTTFSSYPRFKHLQNGLDDLKKDIPKDLDNLLRNCDIRIEKFKSKESSLKLDESDEEESTLIASKLTSTDIALSLIDIDKYT